MMRTCFGFFAALLLVLGGTGVLGNPVAPAPDRSLIESDRIELKSGADRNVFIFTGNVIIVSTNLRVTCDLMEVVALRKSGRDSASAGEGLIGQIGGIEGIVARGNVRIEQAGRIAEAGLARIAPQEGTIELLENPRFIDTASMAVVEGTRIILERGKQEARVEGDPSAGQRSRVSLPVMDDFGADFQRNLSELPAGGSREAREAIEP